MKINTHRLIIFFKKIVLILTFFFLLSLLFIQIFPKLLVSEMSLSFLPYIFLINIFFLTIFTSTFFSFIKKRRKFHAIVFAILLFELIFIGAQLYSFYFMKPMGSNSNSKSNLLKIVLFNKWSSNEEFMKINEKLTTLSPDVITFTEYRKSDESNLEFLKGYKYSYISPDCKDICKFKTDGVGIYSKYPILEKEFISLNGSPNIYVKMEINSKIFDVYVLHPTAPVRKSFLQDRNYQMDFIKNRIQKSNSKDVIIAGDLNMSNWSPEYKNFSKSLNFLNDVAKGQGIKFTWQQDPKKGLAIDLRFLKSSIDHIFVPDYFEVQSFETFSDLGSDHSLVFTEVRF